MKTTFEGIPDNAQKTVSAEEPAQIGATERPAPAARAPDWASGLPALSIRQPWATTILNGKDIENRDWPTRFRGRFLIHAGKALDIETVEAWRIFCHGFISEQAMAWAKEMKIGHLPLGGIIGVAELADCVSSHPSPWFNGPHGFVLRNVAAVPFIPCRGMLGFFKPQF